MPTLLKTLALLSVALLPLNLAHAQNPVFQEESGLVVFEVESTTSPLGEWLVIEPGNPIYVNGATGRKHFEFNGNTPAGGKVNSSLAYQFKIQKAGDYYMYIRARKRKEGEPNDRTNDCYIRVQGDFESATPDIPTSRLKKHTKTIVQGGANSWSWTRNLDAPDAHLKQPVYAFKTGETYTLTISGRSQRFNIDRVVIHHNDITEADARKPSHPESSTAPPINPTPRGFAKFEADFGLLEGKSGDDDDDGMSNFIEYATGSHPNNAMDRGNPPTIQTNAGIPYLSTYQLIDSQQRGLRYTIQESLTLEPSKWAELSSSKIEKLPINGRDDIEEIRYPLPTAATRTDPLFLRLQIEEQF